MTWDTIEGQWDQIKTRIGSRWDRLTGDDLKVIAGQKHVLIGRLQERYRLPRDEAEKEVDGWLSHL